MNLQEKIGKLSVSEAIKNIYVYNIETKEALIYFDSSTI